MPVSKLDPIDRKILNLLQSDGRISINDLAAQVGLSPSPCLRRVRLLEKAGIIKKAPYDGLVPRDTVAILAQQEPEVMEVLLRRAVEADAAVAAYEQELAEAKVRANAIGQEARDAAKADAEAARKKVEAGLEKKLADAEQRIAAIKSGAMKDVGAIAEDTASAIIERLVGKSDKGDVAAAVKSLAR